MNDLGQSDQPVQRFDLSFGVYGCLPLIVVGFDEAKLIIDALNGAVMAPVIHGSPIDTESLLANHGLSGVAGFRVYESGGGCVANVGPNTPPTVNPRPPAFPSVPATPVWPSTTPGMPSAWSCVTGWIPVIGTACTCTRTWTYTNPGPPAVTFTVIQTCISPGTTCPAGGPPPVPTDCSYTYRAAHPTWQHGGCDS